MRRTAELIIDKAPEAIKSKIKSDSSDGSEYDLSSIFSGDSFSQRKREVDRTKLFVSKIEGNTINLRSKSVSYWPLTKISLEEIAEGKTKVTITFKLFFIYVSLYLALLYGVFSSALSPGKTIMEVISNTFPFIIIFVALPILAWWIQNNLKKYLIK